jgi:hypothetical protein
MFLVVDVLKTLATCGGGDASATFFVIQSTET